MRCTKTTIARMNWRRWRPANSVIRSNVAQASACVGLESTHMANETFAVFDTTEGRFKAKLFQNEAPKTVQNFVDLANGTKTGKPFYDGLVFHRVIPNFMIQGGDPEGTGRG